MQVCMKREGDKPSWTVTDEVYDWEMTYTVIPQESLNAEFIKFADQEAKAGGFKDFADFLKHAQAEEEKDK